jgi:hypothetical protein
VLGNVEHDGYPQSACGADRREAEPQVPGDDRIESIVSKLPM